MFETDKETFGAFVAKLRKEKGMTQKELARQLFITDKAVSKWERGLSLPDIKMFEPLAEALGITVFELMACEREERAEIPAEKVGKALHKTMEIAREKQRRTVRKSWVVAGSIALAMVLLVVALYAVRAGANLALDNMNRKGSFPEIGCEFQVELPTREEYVNYYVYEESQGDYEALFHVMGVTADGTEQEMFRLRQSGMRLMWAPKVLWDEAYLYVLFGGGQNLRGEVTMHDGMVDAEPAYFMPFLYRYGFEDRVVEQIKISRDTTSILLDAFTYEGETVWVSQQFQGMLFGLHFEFYQGKDGYCSYDNGQKLGCLTELGGLRTTGYCDGREYFIIGQDGIHRLNLDSGEMTIVKKDFRNCYRAEIGKTKLPDGGEGYVTVTALVTDYEENYVTRGEIREAETVITLYDESWQEMDSVTVPAWCYGMEWGEESLLISDQKDGLTCYLARFSDLSVETRRVPDFQWNVIRDRLDELEAQRSQWVYLTGQGEYVLTGEGADNLRIRE